MSIVDREKIKAVALSAKGKANLDVELIEEIIERLDAEPDFELEEPINASTENSIETHMLGAVGWEGLELLRKRFAKKDLLHFRLYVNLQRKNEPQPKLGYFDVFLRKRDDEMRPFQTCVRGFLVIPDENVAFSGLRTDGALLATYDDIVSFLGDAENPAHTSWIETAVHLNAAWVKPGRTLRAIRYAPRQIYTLLNVAKREEDRDPAIAIFEEGETENPNFRVEAVEGGFVVVPTEKAVELSYPHETSVMIAYNVVRGSALKRYSIKDFDIQAHNTGIVIDWDESTNVEAGAIAPNAWKLRCLKDKDKEPDFRFQVVGFDKNRDLFVHIPNE